MTASWKKLVDGLQEPVCFHPRAGVAAVLRLPGMEQPGCAEIGDRNGTLVDRCLALRLWGTGGVESDRARFHLVLQYIVVNIIGRSFGYSVGNAHFRCAQIPQEETVRYA